MRGLVPTLFLMALVLAGPARAEDLKVAVLPVVAENVGASTQQIVISTVVDGIAKLEMEIVAEDAVAQETQACKSAGCSDPEEAVRIGRLVDADLVVSVTLGREGDGFLVKIVAHYVEEGTSKQEQSTADMAGLLSASVKMLSKVLPEPDPCKHVGCSGHGFCTSVDGEPACECDAGYKVDGLECIKHVVKKKKKKKRKPLVGETTSRQVKATATAGFLITLASLGTFLGSYVSLCIHLRPTGVERKHEQATASAWLGLQISALSTYAIGVPLLLSTNMKVRREMGLRPTSGQSIAGWVLYGVGAVTMGFSFWKKLGFAFPTITIPVLVACSWLAFYEAGEAWKVARESDKIRKQGLQVVPFVAGLERGAVAGIAGVF